MKQVLYAGIFLHHSQSLHNHQMQYEKYPGQVFLLLVHVLLNQENRIRLRLHTFKVSPLAVERIGSVSAGPFAAGLLLQLAVTITTKNR